MSAEILRQAADLMRERAEAATPGPWVPHVRSVQSKATHPHVGWVSTPQNRTTVVENAWDGDVIYIASWHPAVALAVADWLVSTANDVEHVHDPIYNLTSTTVARAFTVARAYLGESA